MDALPAPRLTAVAMVLQLISVGDLEFESALLKAAPVGILVVDPEGMITYASSAAAEMTGYGVHDVVGTNMFDYLVDEAIQGIAESVGYVYEHPDVLMGPLWVGFRHADGEMRVLEVLATNRYDDPQIHGLVVSVRDNTTQARLNDALVSHGRQEDRAVVLRLLSSALLGLPVRARSAVVDVETGSEITSVQLPDKLFGPAPAGARPRPWEEALETGDGVYPTTLDGYDADFRRAAEGAGLETVWAAPIPAPAGSSDDFAACLVIGRVDPWEVTLNERINVDMVVRSAAIVFERDFYLATLNRAATTDALTGLANRAHLFRDPPTQSDGDGATGGTDSEDLPDAVLYMDLDGFKEVNDGRGHLAGDDVLRQMADRLHRLCRRGDEVGRVGGDEFVLLLRDAPDPDIPITVAERILHAAAAPITVTSASGPEEVRIGASVGVVRTVDSQASNLDDLIAAADEALYEAKRAGKNCWRLADPTT